jgi:hypothetical protein
MEKNMFSIPIFQYKIERWVDVKDNLLTQFNNSLSEKIKNDRTMGGHLYTDFFKCVNEDVIPEYIINSLRYIDPYIVKFLDEASEYYNKPNDQIGVSSAWFQKQETNMLHGVHNHGAIGFSAVCYVEFDKDKHLPTTFISPYNDFVWGNTQYYQPDVDEGDIIFFPSCIQHYSPANNSDSDRIIFSFNLK